MGFGEQGKMAFISGGTAKFEGTEEQANLFQRNKETCTPLRGLRMSLWRQNTTKVMVYNMTRNSPL